MEFLFVMGENRKGKFFVISGSSGAGKTVLGKRLLEEEVEMFYNSISDTTRKPRPGEIDGEDYNFVRVQEFKSRIDKGEYLEWDEVHGNYYGTLKIPLFDAINKGKCPLLVIDVQGYRQVRKYVSDDELCSVFILSNEADIVKMINDRGDMGKETLKKRLQKIPEEIAAVGEFKYHLRNDYGKLDLTYSVLKGIVEAEIGFVK